MILNELGLYCWNMDTGGEALADGGGLQSSLVVASRPVRRPWRQLAMVTWLWVLGRGGVDCAWEPLVSCGGFWKNFLFYVAASSRCSHLEIWILPSPCEWVLPVEYGVWILRDACATWFNSGYMFTGGFGQISAFSTLW